MNCWAEEVKSINPVYLVFVCVFEQAALALNNNIWKKYNLTFRGDQTPEIMGVFETLTYRYASCTGLALFVLHICYANLALK